MKLFHRTKILAATLDLHVFNFFPDANYGAEQFFFLEQRRFEHFIDAKC